MISYHITSYHISSFIFAFKAAFKSILCRHTHSMQQQNVIFKHQFSSYHNEKILIHSMDIGPLFLSVQCKNREVERNGWMLGRGWPFRTTRWAQSLELAHAQLPRWPKAGDQRLSVWIEWGTSGGTAALLSPQLKMSLKQCTKKELLEFR